MTYEDALRDIVQRDERVMVLTAENRAAIRNLASELNGRFIDTGITEQAMVGIAAGLALRGRVPVAHALAAFLTMRAFEFIRTDVGIASLPVKLVGGVAGFLSEANGPTHQAIEDVALMRGIPPMHIFCPADEQDLIIGLPHLLASPQPVYIRHTALPPAVDHDRHFEIGQAERIADGRDITILVYGMLLKQAIQARDNLQRQGVSVRLLNMRMLKPVDAEAVLSAAAETRLLVTLEDHFITGGLYSIVCELLVRHQIRRPVLPLALDQRWFKPALLNDVLAYEGFTGPDLADKIKALL
ncbi:MAG: transketolase [Anaerolineae bacterium]|nr:transketolase [Anaerolineae bacterium]